MTQPVLGTAHLYGPVPPDESERLLRAALELGFTSVDTAPSYGHGHSEACVGEVLRSNPERVEVTTKVGILARPAPSRSVRGAKAIARRLPTSVQQRLRAADPSGRPAGQGHFALSEVRTSVENSLRRLRHVDRLLLHEVHVDELTDELLTQLERYRLAGDVTALGVATSNQQTGPCVQRAPELFTTVNISIAPSATQPTLPASVTRVVGHGVFGAGGADLDRLRGRLGADVARAAAWQAATTGTLWGGRSGLADALTARAIGRARLGGVIVASGNVARLQRMHAFITSGDRLPRQLERLLQDMCDELAAYQSFVV